MPVAHNLYYFASNAANSSRPPCVLIHGAGGNQLYWPPQIRRLHDQRIFAVDLPGHGKSDGIGHQTIQEYASDVVEFIGALGLNAAVLAGHSMGGAVAMQAAVQFPDQVLGLCLVGTGARLRVAPSILGSLSDASSFLTAIGLINDLSFSSQASTRLKELAAARMAEVRPSVLHGDFVACSAFNLTDRVSEIAAPSLILCGDEDKMVPAKNSEYLQAQIGGSRLEILPGAGHMVMLEQPVRVAELLTGFLDGIMYRPGRR
jgi:pimeloyl-ACP methyl ester carboxylesterase